MATFSYLTIQSPVNGQYKEKGSKFLAFAFPVGSEVEVRSRVKALKKEYFDARHQGYAYVLGPDKEKFHAYDDGEPNHSTGDPILGQIRSKNLTNVLVSVVRYFGGTKLGVGGLANAYKAAAEDALRKAVIVKMEVMERLNIYYEYEATPEVMRLIKEFNLIIVKEDYREECELILDSKLKNHDLLFEKIKLLIVLGVKMNVNE